MLRCRPPERASLISQMAEKEFMHPFPQMHSPIQGSFPNCQFGTCHLWIYFEAQAVASLPPELDRGLAIQTSFASFDRVPGASWRLNRGSDGEETVFASVSLNAPSARNSMSSRVASLPQLSLLHARHRRMK